MNVATKQRSLWLATLILIASVSPRIADATVVEFQTVRGNFEVNLYDNATPQTVANFLSYASNLAYVNSVFHRSVPGFIVQGGGFDFNAGWPLNPIQANAPVVNEPEFSNVRGTIAMAKVAGDPNSATNQWFFNLADNSANLDAQNGGFTVFGEVMGNGMDVLDAIAGLERFNFGAPFTDLPLQAYTDSDFDTGLEPDDRHLIIVTAIVVSDSTVDSAAGLNPPANTSVTATPAPAPAGDSGGGGGISLLLLFGLLLGYRARLR